MNKGARYKVQTQYGWFSLDEGAYKDYLAGKLWITWPPACSSEKAAKPEEIPPEVSKDALRLRDAAHKNGVLETLQRFRGEALPPFKERMRETSIDELNLSVRASNGLKRAGIHTFGKLSDLMSCNDEIFQIRNLGAKSTKEIKQAFMSECYNRLIPYEKAEFWQKIMDS